MLGLCWHSVADAGPTLTQNWFSIFRQFWPPQQTREIDGGATLNQHCASVSRKLDGILIELGPHNSSCLNAIITLIVDTYVTDINIRSLIANISLNLWKHYFRISLEFLPCGVVLSISLKYVKKTINNYKLKQILNCRHVYFPFL